MSLLTFTVPPYINIAYRTSFSHVCNKRVKFILATLPTRQEQWRCSNELPSLPIMSTTQPDAPSSKESFHQNSNTDSLFSSAQTLQNSPLSNQAETIVVDETAHVYSDARYGVCPSCQSPVAIPGLVHMLCPKCGWVNRRDDVSTVAPGHHD